jgi:hypothetical protein
VVVASLAGAAAGIGFGLLVGKTQRGGSDSHVRRQVLGGASLLAGVLVGNLAAMYVLDEPGWALASGLLAVVTAIVAFLS